MKKRSLFAKFFAIVNALVITAAFVGCPARRDPSLVTIAPPPVVAIAPPPPPFVTIAPYGGNLQQLLPSDQSPPPALDTKNENRSR
jgi:hypothetical protein